MPGLNLNWGVVAASLIGITWNGCIHRATLNTQCCMFKTRVAQKSCVTTQVRIHRHLLDSLHTWSWIRFSWLCFRNIQLPDFSTWKFSTPWPFTPLQVTAKDDILYFTTHTAENRISVSASYCSSHSPRQCTATRLSLPVLRWPTDAYSQPW